MAPKLITIWRKAVRVAVIVKSCSVSTLAMIEFVAYSPRGKIMFSVLPYLHELQRFWLSHSQPGMPDWAVGRRRPRLLEVDLDLDVGPIIVQKHWAGECTKMRISRRRNETKNMERRHCLPLYLRLPKYWIQSAPANKDRTITAHRLIIMYALQLKLCRCGICSCVVCTFKLCTKFHYRSDLMT